MKVRHLFFVACAVALLSSAAVAQEAPALTNWARGASYTVNLPPAEQYPDSGGELTDGQYANAFYGNPNWVGHLRNTSRVITVDLGAVRPVQEVRANFLQDFSVGIRYPQQVTVEVSADGTNWQRVATETVVPESLGTTSPVIRQAVFTGFDVQARYVRLVILVDVWVFIDEIEVLGA